MTVGISVRTERRCKRLW